MNALAKAADDPERSGSEESGAMTARSTRRGTLLAGKYRLEALLGEGGMACVWRAYNEALEVPVALKLLRAGPASLRLPQRLRLEARAAARLVHPSIVRVFDVGVAEDSQPFIVMELLTGKNLADELSGGRVGGLRAVQLLLPIAEALTVAHAEGIVHRDLKPENVFLSTGTERCQPKLLDFGIAKLYRASAVAAKLTEVGTTLGSPSYMAPEQARGDDVDYRADIWSFCVVLYEAISGAAPFDRADPPATLDAILNDEPAPLPLGNGVDERLARLIHAGLAKDPAQRPASMRELGEKLAWWLLGQGVAADVTGASLAATWLVPGDTARAPEVVMERRRAPSPKSELRRVAAARPRLPAWVLPAVAGLLLVSGSIAWASSSQSAHLTGVSAPARPAALVGASSPKPPLEPVVIANSPAAPPAAVAVNTPSTSSSGEAAPAVAAPAKSDARAARLARLPF